MSELLNKPLEDNDVEDDYEDDYEDEIIDYTDMIKENAFVGDIPFNTILEGITEQFSDYINLEDKNNYVDIFYDQWNMSMKIVESDDEEDHPQEIKEALENIKNEFIDKIHELFKQRLTITILAVDDESTPDVDELELVIRELYEFFILNARNNFKNAITISINLRLSIDNVINEDTSDKEFFNKVNMLLDNYSPLVTCMTPRNFLEYNQRDDIIELFDEGQVSGNFLRKYTAKLYQNEEYKVELINHILMSQMFKNKINI